MAFSIILSLADPRTEIVARICGNVRVQNVSNYFQYYSRITDYMQDEMYRNKFAFKDVGKPPDRLFVLSQCMDDLSPDECAVCFTQINTIIPGCFPNTGGRVYLDGCFSRAENYSFYREALGPHDTTRCGADVNPRPDFRNAVVKVLDEMLIKAPLAGPVWRGFAVNHETSHGITAYGMASCWKILDKDLCYTCLSNAASSALSCLPSTEARVLNAGCFLRYADFSFANESTGEIREQIFSSITYIIGVVTICLLAIGIGVCVGKHTYRRKNGIKNLKGMEDLLLDERLQFLQFKHATILKATENFQEVHRLGEGGYGEVYKGTLADGREIAVKRLYASRDSQIREICNEMDIISSAQHKNLVRFLGCCFTSGDSFLVYEYMANRSLDLMLFDPAKKKELTWKKRLLIITGTAEGLEYLHMDCQVRIIHRDIKASNVLLDLKYKPKISDFGLARFYSCDHSLINTAIAGTLGYMAPEYIAKGRLTEKVDVYSFGVLVIEIVTGIQNNKHQSEDIYETLIAHVWKHFQSNTISEIIDKDIEIEDMKEIERVIQIGLLCTQESPNSRPTMTKVVQMLRKKDFELPQPSKPPFTDEHMELHYLGSDYQQRHSFSD
ncbi:cysteine-rich receptor-like protein kinase 46 isoform X2 [Hevea brasiliensis]|uniref:cysteine-rich receptor-like protein kinase 46 isoform X2 n=1 Tax=Hevea brasiliensis TaxID=3981 RepID=UPI0025CCBB65|nr:cysteine-rich receptor-like protein kinase 46 isoform X2 [Hevea brasiliensis]